MSINLKTLRPIINKINTTQSIIGVKQIIDSYTPSHYANFLSEYKNLNIKPVINKYGYIKYPLYTNTFWNIYIIKWTPDSKSPIHNHDDAGCIMKILDGTFTEYQYQYIFSRFFPQKKLTKIKKYKIHESVLVDTFHSIHNNSIEDSFSLHIYPNSNFKPTVLD